MNLLLLALPVAAASAVDQKSGALGLTVDPKTGAYSVSVNGAPWFTGADYEFTANHKTAKSSDGSLKLDSATMGAGADASGGYKSTKLSWASGAFVTEFKEYGVSDFRESLFCVHCARPPRRGRTGRPCPAWQPPAVCAIARSWHGVIARS